MLQKLEDSIYFGALDGLENDWKKGFLGTVSGY